MINVFEGREFPAVDDPRWWTQCSGERYNLGSIQVSRPRVWQFHLAVDGTVVARGSKVEAYFDAIEAVMETRAKMVSLQRHNEALNKGAAIAKGKAY